MCSLRRALPPACCHDHPVGFVKGSQEVVPDGAANAINIHAQTLPIFMQITITLWFFAASASS